MGVLSTKILSLYTLEVIQSASSPTPIYNTFVMEQYLSELAASDVVFVATPPSMLEVECPVCLCLLVDPRLSDCCGHHFCGKCLDKIKNQLCPLCKKPFTTMRDLGLQRAILSMQAYCLHRPNGCDWQGEVRLLHEHINCTIPVDKGCPYTLVECPLNCGVECLRSKVQSHMQLQCPKRMMKCQFCNNLFLWQELDEEHGGVCPKSPVDCPNGCEYSPIRSQLQNHLDSECSLQVVKCEFVECMWKGQRKALKHHLDGNWREHLLQTTQCFLEKLEAVTQQLSDQASLIEGLYSQISKLEEENSSLRVRVNIVETSVFTLEEKANELQDDVHGSSTDSESDLMEDYISSTTFAVGRFSSRKISGETYNCPPFYANPGGYKLRVEIKPSGTGLGLGTHVSLYFYLVPGRHDARLKWPFRGSVTIALKNHNGPDYERTLHYNKRTDESCATVTDDRRPSDGYGFDRFIPHEELDAPIFGAAYLVDDRLQFRMVKITY